MDMQLSADDRIQEANHRIKNNLQMVVSMLALQSRQNPSLELREELGDAAHRVMAVALLHDRLQRDGDDSVEMGSYLEEICRDLALSGNCQKRGIRIELSTETVRLPGDVAVAVGLIVSELVTNALKHACDRGPGVVGVRLERNAEDWRLSVADNGPGLAGTVAGGRGFGLRLIGRLAQKLDGALTAVSDGVATRFCVDFPVLSEAPASLCAPRPAAGFDVHSSVRSL